MSLVSVMARLASISLIASVSLPLFVKPLFANEPAKVVPINEQRSVPGTQIIAPGLAKITEVKTIPVTSDGIIYVTHDRAQVLPVVKGVSALVIGNPLIADVAIQQGGFMVVTAKGSGTTNMIGVDSKGNTIFDRLIKVQFPTEQIVRVFRADNRETLTCSPICTRTPTIGDATDVFTQGLGQATSRTATLSGAASGGTGGRRD